MNFFMKKLILTSVILLTVFTLSMADNEKEIKGTIGHVTVYPDRAQVVQDASFDLQPGKTVIKLKGLSPYIDAQSIQAKGFGDFTILSVNLQNNYLQNLEEVPEVKTIRGQIEALRLKIEDEKAAISTLDEKQSFLTANKAIMVKEATFSIEQFKTMMDLYTNNMDQITTAKLKKNRAIKDYEKELTVLQQQLADKVEKSQLPSGEISVSVSADKAVTGKMTFSYVVANAGWYPSYDIRVDDINKPVVIFYKANVYQNTGVEWKNVKLSFSNATPWVAGDVPILNPWFVDFFNVNEVVVVGYGSKKKSAAAEPMLRAEEMQMADRSTVLKKEAQAPVAVVEKKVGEMSVTFDVAIPYTITADGKVQTIEIQRTTTPAEYRYVTVPKMSTLAYLTGNITDWAKQSLLSGEATLYFENSYVGKSYLNVNQLTDTLTVSLGTDNSILVKREKRKDFTTTRVIGANKTETYSFLITVRNNKANPVKLTVNDQVPVSSNSSIVVEAAELSGGRMNVQTGLVKWDLDLKPQEKKELVLSYTVKYPKNQNVILE
jgi:uncharacterized protein (TIGR02231 family)